MAKKGFGIAGMLGEPRSGYPGGGGVGLGTERWDLVKKLYKKYKETGGTKTLGEFGSDVLFQIDRQEGPYFKKGGRIGMQGGMTPSESWMRDYFYSGKGGYDDSGMTFEFFEKNIGPDLWYRHIGRAKGGRIGFQRAGLATLPRIRRVKPGYDQEFTLQRGVSAAPIKQSTVLEEILGGGILGIGASKLLKDKDKPVTKKTKESKTPETTPPEDKGPDIVPEIVGEVVSQKLLEDLVDVEEINWDQKTGKETSTWKTYKRSDKNRPPTEDEIEDYMEILPHGGELGWNDFGNTIEELDAAVAEHEAEWEYYKGQYMRGELDKYVKPEILEEQRVSRQKKISKVIEKAYEEIDGGSGFTGTDYKYDAQILADSIAEQLGKGAYDELPQTYQTEIYNAAQSAVSEQAKIKQDIKKLSKPTKTLEGLKKTGIINISDDEVAEEFSRFMKESDPEGFKDIEEKIQIESFDPKDRKKNALGGRIGLGTGGPTYEDFEEFMEDIQKGKKWKSRQDLLENWEKYKKWKYGDELSGGYLPRDEVAQGGRISLDTGGPPITLQRPMFNEGGLTKTVPPKKGPMPQGLPSALYNGIIRSRSY